MNTSANSFGMNDAEGKNYYSFLIANSAIDKEDC